MPIDRIRMEIVYDPNRTDESTARTNADPERACEMLEAFLDLPDASREYEYLRNEKRTDSYLIILEFDPETKAFELRGDAENTDIAHAILWHMRGNCRHVRFSPL